MKTMHVVAFAVTLSVLTIGAELLGAERCRLEGERTDGRNKICSYSCASGEAATTVGSSQRCPSHIDKDEISQPRRTYQFTSPLAEGGDAMREHQEAQREAERKRLELEKLRRDVPSPNQTTPPAPPKEIAARTAWVLWIRTAVTGESDRAKKQVPVTIEPLTWEARDGFEQLEECRRTGGKYIRDFGVTVTAIEQEIQANPALEKVLREMASRLIGGAIDPIENSVLAKIPTQGGGTRFTSTSFACFPGGFDPRPR